MGSEEPIMLSALEHYSYCPRQFALIHIEQAFDHNVHTKRGDAVHERVDAPGFSTIEGTRSERALPVWSERYGLIGRCDVVEFSTDGTPFPVEYKHGVKRIKEHDDLQLTAQAMCLEEMMGRAVTRGAIYYFSSHRRREVAITEALRQTVLDTISLIRQTQHNSQSLGALPPPANDKRCDQCSLINICQPQVISQRSVVVKAHAALFQPDAN
jgi:CRISPR-associated exonuclease Cas4